MRTSTRYTGLPRGYIRLLELLHAADEDSSSVECRLHSVRLEDVVTTATTGIDATRGQDGQLWPELSQQRWDYAKLFSNKDFSSSVKEYRRNQFRIFQTTPSSKTTGDEQQHLSSAYLALSYVWGASTQERHVVVDGQMRQVTDNLYAALSQLRSRSVVRRGLRVWADAICFNQEDLEERAQQVQLMRQIYSRAAQVVIWLGSSNEFTELAFTAVHWIAERGYEAEDTPYQRKGVQWTAPHLFGFMQMHRQANTLPFRNEVVLSLWHLFTLEYWRRLWILLEAASATPNAPILWGSYCVSVMDLKAAAAYIEANERWLGRRVACAVGSGVPLQLAPQDFTRDRDLYYQDSTPGRLWKLNLRIFNLRVAESGASKGVVAAFDVLDLTRKANATEERDKFWLFLDCQLYSRSQPLSQTTL